MHFIILFSCLLSVLSTLKYCPTISGACVHGYYIGDEDKTTTVMATHGSLSPFDPSTEDWTSYTQRMNYYFVANEVADGAKKRSILLSACGPTYKIIRNLVEEDKLDTTSYEDIVKRVKAHFDPTPSAIMERYKFNTRVREEGESVAAYVAALRDITQHCESLQDMLHDRLVCGVRHKGITNRLLAEKKLDYDKALEVAQAIESAETNTKQLQSTPPTAVGTPKVQLSTQPTATAPQVNRTTHPSKGRGQRKQTPTVRICPVTDADVMDILPPSASLRRQCVTPARRGGTLPECADLN
jgi:hypothetical protein